MDLAKLVVKLEAQTAQYMQQLDAANRKLDKFAKNSAISSQAIGHALGEAIAGATRWLVEGAKGALEYGDKLDEMAQKTGMSAESLSRLEYAAKFSGLGIDDLGKASAKLSKSMADAADGSKTSAEAFARVGVAVKNSDGTLRDTEDVLLDVADKFSKMEDGAAKAALAQELFGKSGVALIPFLNEGREGITKLTAEADKFGVTVSGKAAKQSAAFNDNLDKLKGTAQGLTRQFLEKALPTLIAISDRFVSAAKSGGGLSAALGVLAVAFKGIVTAGSVVSAVFSALGNMIYGVGAAIVRVAHGDFSLAIDEIKDSFGKARSSTADSFEFMAQVWGDSVPELEGTAKKLDDALTDTIVFSPEKSGDAARKAADAALSGIRDMVANLEQQIATFGLGEKAVIAYRIAHGDLAAQFKAAGADAEAYKERLIELTGKMVAMRDASEENAAFLKSVDDAVKNNIDATAKQIEDGLKAMTEAAKTQTEFERRATENVQDILATGIGDIIDQGFKRGAKSALKSFADMLEQMIQQAIAADLARKLFGAGGVGSGGGWLGGMGNMLSKLFGGTRDSGGRGRAGQAYLIGTGAQPEMFVPDSSGDFIPATAMARGSGSRVVQNIYVQGRVDQRSARQLELEASRRQSIARARFG